MSGAQLRLQAETLASFEWLTGGLGRDQSVSFVPNPGNIGDAAINLACWMFLSGRFRHVELCGADTKPSHRIVFIGGGGNLVEPLYRRIAEVVRRLAPDHSIHIFPATVYGYDEILRRCGAGLRIVCREAVSYQFVCRAAPEAAIRLGHDAAFALASELLRRTPIKAAPHGIEAKLYRTDLERAIDENGGLDIMAQQHSPWLDMETAARWIDVVARYLLGFSRVYTDRLHCAILSAILDRETVLLPNSYFKNSAVFDQSLFRFPNVRFDRSIEAVHTRENDPVAFREGRASNGEAPIR